MADLEKLVRDYAYWADQYRSLKKQAAEESAQCTYEVESYVNGDPINCIGYAYKETEQIRRDNGEVYHSFEETWGDLVCEGKICTHCQNVRRLKAKRALAGRRLGAIRAAFTRVGRRLNKEAAQ